MNNYKGFRIFTGFIIAVFSVMMFQVNTLAQFESSAESAILIDAVTGQVLYEKNPDTAMPPASITKIMTLLIGFGALEQEKVKWDDQIIISEKA